jgi:hypothetical protein
MKKPMMKGTPRKVRKFAEGGSYFVPDSEKYTGDDEIVKYRMGQIKDPGVDLFKLARGESQVAKPVEFEKNKYMANKDMDNRDVGESKTETKVDKVEDAPVPFKRTPLITEPPSGKAPVKANAPVKKPVIKEEIKTTVVAPAKPSSAIDTDDPEYRKKPFLERLKLESGAAYNDAKNKIKNTSAEDLATTALGMFPAFRGIKALAAGKNAFDKARDVTPKPDQIGMDARRIGMDARRQIGMNPRQIGMNPRKQLELDKSGQSNRASSSGAMKDDFKPGDLRSDFKKGGKIKKMASGGKVKSASARADGCAIRGKTRA